jgi:3'-phosphoadenosine 5'-phosphosulfate sulfotransferase (PAPS reductase)/FAD synthetase
MSKLESLKSELSSIVDSSKDPILCWSGGKDSTFLLSILRELDYNLPVLVFPHFWSKYQLEFIKKIVVQYKLQTFFYRPTFLDYKENTIIAFYNIGGKNFPVLIDQIKGNECGIDKANKALAGVVPHFLWDSVILGTKRLDSHPLIPSHSFSEFPEIRTPLWEWTDDEVLQTTRKMGIPYDKRVYEQGDEEADTGNFVGCLNCVRATHAYCPKVNQMIRGLNYGT